MKSDYVKAYAQLEVTHWWFAVRKKIILQSLVKYVAPGSGKKVLNIGAAGGASSQWLARFGEVSSVENEPLFLQYLQEQHVQVVNASVEELPFADNSFDLVCAFDVVEHVVNDNAALAEMHRVCKPGGTICITVPAYQSLWGRHDVANGHQRRYTSATLRAQLPHGCSILYSTYFNTLLFIPVLIARKIDWLLFKKKKAASDFENFGTGGIAGMVCKFIFGLETGLLKIMRLPFGVSLLLLAEKSISEEQQRQ